MNVTVMKRISFCAGHRLVNHGGKCEHFHGHNYRVDIYVTCSQLDEVGRVVDFAELKDLFQNWIDEHWDHGFILNQQDENGIQAIQHVHPCKAYVLPYNPTAENLARYLLEHVSPTLLAGESSRRVSIDRIAVWETDSNYAEVVRDAAGRPGQGDWDESQLRV